MPSPRPSLFLRQPREAPTFPGPSCSAGAAAVARGAGALRVRSRDRAGGLARVLLGRHRDLQSLENIKVETFHNVQPSRAVFGLGDHQFSQPWP